MLREKYIRILSCIVPAAAFVYLLNISWLRWGNLITDTFRDPWVAHKISGGAILYRDIHYIFGPLAAYLNSSIFKIFGTNTIYLVFLGICLTVVTSVLVYRVTRLFLGRFFSTLAVLNFLFVFAFGCYCYNGIFNFILPYSFASTLFIVFVLSALYSFIKFVKRNKPFYLLCWSAAVYAAFLSRPGMCLAVWMLFLAIFLVYTHKQKKSLFVVCNIVGPFLLALTTYWIFLHFNGAWDGFKESVMRTFVIRERAIWEANISGLDNAFLNLGIVVKSLVAQFAVAFFLYAGAASVSLIERRLRSKISRALIYGIPFLLSVLFGSYLLRFMSFFNQYRPVPLLLVLGSAVYSRRLLFGSKINRKENISLLALYLVSAFLVARIALKASPNMYGFYLLIPGLTLYYIFFAKSCPTFFGNIIPIGAAANKYYALSLCIFFTLLAMPFAEMNAAVYADKKFRIRTPRGNIRSFNDQISERFCAAVDYLIRNTPEDTKVVVFPEGVGINFFSSRDNPLPYFNFVPTQVDKIGEDKIIQSLDMHDVDYVILLKRETVMWGYPFFGTHYGKKIYAYILERYRLVKLFGPYPFTSKEFGIAIFGKK